MCPLRGLSPKTCVLTSHVEWSSPCIGGLSPLLTMHICPCGTNCDSADESAKFWSVESGTCLRTLTGHSHMVRSAAWSTVA
jgi:WD40 repeat protein